jgi:hypothetical protein
MNETTLARYQREYRQSPEGKIVRKVVKALNASPDKAHHVVGVWDGEEFETATSPDEVLDLLSNLDQGHIVSGDYAIETDRSATFFRTPLSADNWVFIVNGNEWDALSDYTTDLDEVLASVNAWVDEHQSY